MWDIIGGILQTIIGFLFGYFTCRFNQEVLVNRELQNDVKDIKAQLSELTKK